MTGTTKNISILGAKESGIGTAILAEKENWTVFVSDLGKIEPKFKNTLKRINVEWEEGQHNIERILKSDIIVKSPGIPDNSKIIIQIKEAKIKIISEIEFASYYSNARTICITGSNGKTTTSMLVYHILKKAKVNVGLAGNIGESFAKQVAKENFDWYVLELSSFQLDYMMKFKADIAIIMNITPDHLDRYEYNMQNYIDSKFRIIQNQTKDDWLIYNYDDPIIQQEIKKRKIKARVAPFSLREKIQIGGYLDNKRKEIIININENLNMSIHNLALKGRHNAQNSLASGIASRILEIRKSTVRESLGDFVNVEHRLEFVAKVHGIEFINDSKATNINSTWFALESMENKTIWIVGGVDKGNDYEELAKLVEDKVKTIICLGKENEKIMEAFRDKTENIIQTKSIIEAVAYGYRFAKKGETVLLSPACASFDLFENYEERGNEFKKAVRSL